jgi:hypothetical protein
MQNEGSSGYVDENRQEEVSGVRYQVSETASHRPTTERWTLRAENYAK